MELPKQLNLVYASGKSLDAEGWLLDRERVQTARSDDILIRLTW
jgi:hypothetical protein